MTITFTDGSTSIGSSETNLFDITADNHFATWIFTHNMASGDTFVFRTYVKDQNGGTMRLYDTVTLNDDQTNDAYLIPYVTTKEYKVTIQKTAGTDRTFTWQRIQVV